MRKTGIVIALVAFMTLALASAALAGPVMDRIVKKGELVVGTATDYPPSTSRPTTAPSWAWTWTWPKSWPRPSRSS